MLWSVLKYIYKKAGGKMKKLLAVVILSYLFTGCAATHMQVVQEKKSLKVGDQAALVIVRDVFLGNAVAVWNYLDGKLIGETKGNTFFITMVTPGKHYVVSESENVTVVQIDFKPGKAYYLRQDIWMGFWRANAGYSVLSQAEAVKAMKECEYWMYDRDNNPGENIDPAKYAQAIKDYHIDVKKNPAGYKPFLEYEGYKP